MNLGDQLIGMYSSTYYIEFAIAVFSFFFKEKFWSLNGKKSSENCVGGVYIVGVFQ